MFMIWTQGLWFLQGPVHAYVSMAGGRTAYLAELHTGSQVLVVDAQGRSRPVLVGRVKIESRPLLLVEVEVEGQRHSVLLQNAETVCLVTSAGACCLQQCDISKQWFAEFFSQQISWVSFNRTHISCYLAFFAELIKDFACRYKSRHW
jgi:hypothetical protein